MEIGWGKGARGKKGGGGRCQGGEVPGGKGRGKRCQGGKGARRGKRRGKRCQEPFPLLSLLTNVGLGKKVPGTFSVAMQEFKKTVDSLLEKIKAKEQPHLKPILVEILKKYHERFGPSGSESINSPMREGRVTFARETGNMTIKSHKNL
jgi:hypothetical protein